MKAGAMKARAMKAWALKVGASDEDYFLSRMEASLASARAAPGSIARLAHFELAGRYSVAAVAAGRSPGP
jgi:hypothetical protein